MVAQPKVGQILIIKQNWNPSFLGKKIKVLSVDGHRLRFELLEKVDYNGGYVGSTWGWYTWDNMELISTPKASTIPWL